MSASTTKPRKPRITQSDAAELSLVMDLAAALNRSVKAVAKQAVGRGRDTRRCFTARQREALCAREGGCCFYCGAPTPLAEGRADHVIPHARGGRTVLENGAWSCDPCNAKKSDKVW